MMVHLHNSSDHDTLPLCHAERLRQLHGLLVVLAAFNDTTINSQLMTIHNNQMAGPSTREMGV